ncbi:MAG: aldehyde dehydrogenase family protein [Actinomycetota bacterium]|nr:aldehyde dehydrogenase family protein [Actinomycetota bacterium]MDP2289203.1 aldehyde dehydrogenase family protein [Actinomycetota bacterium]
MSRLEVRKTYKLYVGGQFPRSESGRVFEVNAADGEFVTNMAKASRKDARDAVLAARKGFHSWSSATAYNRGQVMYRIAEVMEGRSAQFADELQLLGGGSAKKARLEVEQAIDRMVWYAGWADKLTQVVGTANPVAGPYFNFSIPEPTGVVVAAAPSTPALLGLVNVLAPIIVSGNSAIIVASETRPIAAITMAEVLDSSDVPAGAVNILTGSGAEILPWLASHADVNALDLSGVADAELAVELEREAAGTLKRVLRTSTPADQTPSLQQMIAFLEIKTVWHPMGL